MTIVVLTAHNTIERDTTDKLITIVYLSLSISIVYSISLHKKGGSALLGESHDSGQQYGFPQTEKP